MPPVCLVIGAGAGIGGNVARRFAREGYIACVTRRNVDKLEPLGAGQFFYRDELRQIEAALQDALGKSR